MKRQERKNLGVKISELKIEANNGKQLDTCLDDTHNKKQATPNMTGTLFLQ